MSKTEFWYDTHPEGNGRHLSRVLTMHNGQEIRVTVKRRFCNSYDALLWGYTTCVKLLTGEVSPKKFHHYRAESWHNQGTTPTTEPDWDRIQEGLEFIEDISGGDLPDGAFCALAMEWGIL